jgi:hypothetical protein
MARSSGKPEPTTPAQVRVSVFRLAVWLAAGVVLSLAGVFLIASRVPAAASNPSTAQELLPDLDQETPSQLQVQMTVAHGRRSFRLGFRSAVRNLGDGPLIVNGARPGRDTPEMTVDQVVERIGAAPKVIHGVGRMRYVVSPDHRHWHYLSFDRYSLQTYELHSVDTGPPPVEDQKTGFCLGDRYPVTTRRVQAAPAEPVFTSRCGLTQPGRLSMHEGISVGYGDDYSAFLEGQDLPLGGLPDGRYVLVHRVNADHGLKELTYANNAASVLLDLRWRDGQPYLSVIATCPDTANCGNRDGHGTPRP